MEINEYEKWKKMLLSGIIFAFITMVLGEIPIGWVEYPETGNELLDIIMGSGNLTVLQMASGVFFGGIFIPLQYYGFKAIAEILLKTECKHCAKITEIGAKAIALGGGIVHVMCVALMFVCRMENTSNLTQIPQSVMDFTLWLVLPFSAVFMVVYLPMTIAIAVPVVSGKTVFPKWAIIFNPLTGKILLNVLAMVLPNSKFINGIRMSNMGIGALITFVGWWILLEQYQKTETS
ncbi:MAG: hypothetical protein NC124_12230 [Clostridium sp.]|nr:hypothetical protein [Clostridium sp.]